MNKSFDTTTINTLLNSCDRWDNSHRSDRDILLLKVPKRRPSDTFRKDGPLLVPLKPKANYQNFEGHQPSVDSEQKSLSQEPESKAFDGWASGAWLYVPQFPVPENKHLRRKISFAEAVEKREYALTIGDNPSCHGPCALTLDWFHTGSELIPYNDDLSTFDTEDCSDGGMGDSPRSCGWARYLLAEERRERVLPFMAAGPQGLRELERQMASVDMSQGKGRRAVSSKREAVWQRGKGHVRRPSYDEPEDT